MSLSIKGSLPPKPLAVKNPEYLKPTFSLTPDDHSLVQTYPLLRKILQSRILLTSQVLMREEPLEDEVNPRKLKVTTHNPNLKYELLEYLVTESEDAEAQNQGRDRGGRSRKISQADKAYNEIGMIILSKRENQQTRQAQSVERESQHDDYQTNNSFNLNQRTSPTDEWQRLKNLSLKSLGNQSRTITFKTCSTHPREELVMYDKINKQLLCCRCLAMLQMKQNSKKEKQFPPNKRVDTKEIVMADDYCLQWVLKWRELSQSISQLKEAMENRAAINGLLFAQIQNFVIKEALKARFQCSSMEQAESNNNGLVITEFAQRIYEAEQLVLGYESAGAADSVHTMELAYHLFLEDINKLTELTKSTDLFRENHIVQTIGRYLICQLEGTPLDQLDKPASSSRNSVIQKGKESIFSTVDESPNPKEVDECDPKSSSYRRVSRKPPIATSTQEVKVQQTPQSKASILKGSPHLSSVQPLNGRTSQQRSHSVAFLEQQSQQSLVTPKKQPVRNQDDFWENTSEKKQTSKSGTSMMGLLSNLSSLRVQLKQTCALSDTLKQAALEAEIRGDAFKALELMSETHTTIVKMRGLETKLEEVKRSIVKAQEEKHYQTAQSRNQGGQQQQKAVKRGGSQTRPYKYLKGLI